MNEMTSMASLAKQLAGHAKVLVAFSGGLDSTVLLHQLVQLRRQQPALRLRAVHVHHGLSSNAACWVAHCQAVCHDWQVPLHIARVKVDGRQQGIEAAAREARYQAIRQQLLPGEVVMTAQHADDQAETVLLALKRGSGPAGLASMPLRMPFAGTWLLRPLLQHNRQQLEKWAQQHCLRWIEDESNRDVRYDRNFLRQRILPLMSARWPHFAAAAGRSAELCARQEQLLDELLAESLAQLMTKEGGLMTAPLHAMSEVRRDALLRRWIRMHGGKMPSREQLCHLWRDVITSREDAKPCLQLGKAQIRRYRQTLYWLTNYASLRCCVLPWPSPWCRLTLPDALGSLYRADKGTYIRPPTHEEVVTVRFDAAGEFYICGRVGRRAIKKLWQEFAVPPWRRHRIPLIYYNEQLIAAVGVFVTREGEADGQSGWYIGWQNA